MAARRGGLGKGLDSLISPGHSAKAEAKEKRPIHNKKSIAEITGTGMYSGCHILTMLFMIN